MMVMVFRLPLRPDTRSSKYIHGFQIIWTWQPVPMGGSFSRATEFGPDKLKVRKRSRSSRGGLVEPDRVRGLRLDQLFPAWMCHQLHADLALLKNTPD